MVIKGFIAFIGTSGFFLAIKRIQFNEAVTLMFISPAWYFIVHFNPRTGIFSYLILKEPYTLFDFSSCVFSFMGAILIVQPAFIFDIFTGNTTISTYD